MIELALGFESNEDPGFDVSFMIYLWISHCIGPDKMKIARSIPFLNLVITQYSQILHRFLFFRVSLGF